MMLINLSSSMRSIAFLNFASHYAQTLNMYANIVVI